MKDDRLPKVVFFCQPSKVKQKAFRLRIGWVEVVTKNLFLASGVIGPGHLPECHCSMLSNGKELCLSGSLTLTR